MNWAIVSAVGAWFAVLIGGCSAVFVYGRLTQKVADHDDKLKDHEGRIRHLEKRHP